MILLSSLHTRASEVRCGGHLTVARQGFLRSRMEEVEAFLDMDRHASWTGNHRFYHRFFWWFFILCFVKISGRVALFLFWAAQEHGGIYIYIYIYIIIYMCIYIYIYVYIYIYMYIYIYVCVYIYNWLIVDLLPFITMDWEGETSGWAAISALFPTEATGRPAELWIEFPQKLGKSKFQPCPIHPPIWNISACSSDVQIWRHMNEWRQQQTLIYIRDFCRFIHEQKGFCCLKKTCFFSS